MVTNPNKNWSAGKDAFLKANYGTTANMMIEQCLGCSLHALEERIKQLGLL